MARLCWPGVRWPPVGRCGHVSGLMWRTLVTLSILQAKAPPPPGQQHTRAANHRCLSGKSAQCYVPNQRCTKLPENIMDPNQGWVDRVTSQVLLANTTKPPSPSLVTSDAWTFINIISFHKFKSLFLGGSGSILFGRPRLETFV